MTDQILAFTHKFRSLGGTSRAISALRGLASVLKSELEAAWTLVEILYTSDTTEGLYLELKEFSH